MALANSGEMLRTARQQGYCIGAFNAVDYLTMDAVIQTAAEENAPVIIQTSPVVVQRYGPSALVGMARVLVERYPVPVGLHLDHGKDSRMIEACIEAGFTSVMIDASNKPFEENVKCTRHVVQMAHARNVAVEAEIGILAGIV